MEETQEGNIQIELVKALMAQISALSNQVDNLQRQQLASTNMPAPEPHVALPEKFSGARKDNIKNFMSTVKTVFRLQPSRFPSSDSKVLYIGTLLTDNAQTWFRTLEESNHPALLDINNFFALLGHTYGDPNSTWKAQMRLSKIRQGTSNCLTYSTLFKSIALEADFNEAALIKLFYDGLNDEIKDTLSTMDRIPGDFELYTALCIRIDNRIAQRRTERLRREPWIPNRTFSRKDTESMDIDIIGTKRLTEDERDHRRYNKLCFYCANPNHTLKECPRKMKQLKKMFQKSIVQPDSPISEKLKAKNTKNLQE
ncbi:Retrotransposon-derived protein PEG10 [Zancudomyces culisetae]|uniref:Retrotransposon-derived protein PEG10 n=1 Tax=Zancudomyces culisetae TaxID=1213189 RepID=A0A1R1PTN9_ZANCU|nr:Retrotransposon-derived protein PEG10 [Zancudomyces culisetae]|eukprot:OMH84328.1 Retrotransposon-derived protein PEG10 [Zancudomyces culisetae]